MDTEHTFDERTANEILRDNDLIESTTNIVTYKVRMIKALVSGIIIGLTLTVFVFIVMRILLIGR